MDAQLYRRAAEIVAGEPVSIEPDGTVWADSDGRIVDPIAINAEVKRLETVEAERVEAEANARAAAMAHAKSLGFTEEMIAVMYPGLTV